MISDEDQLRAALPVDMTDPVLRARLLAAAIVDSSTAANPKALAVRTGLSERTVREVLSSREFKHAIRHLIDSGLSALAAQAVGMLGRQLPSMEKNPDLLLRALRTMAVAWDKFGPDENAQSELRALQDRERVLASLKPIPYNPNNADIKAENAGADDLDSGEGTSS